MHFLALIIYPLPKLSAKVQYLFDLHKFSFIFLHFLLHSLHYIQKKVVSLHTFIYSYNKHAERIYCSIQP